MIFEYTTFYSLMLDDLVFEKTQRIQILYHGPHMYNLHILVDHFEIYRPARRVHFFYERACFCYLFVKKLKLILDYFYDYLMGFCLYDQRLHHCNHDRDAQLCAGVNI